jgi:hypothetical protein
MKYIYIFIAFWILNSSAYSQKPTKIVSIVQDSDTVYSQGKINQNKTYVLFGVGFGLDYGFLGGNLTIWPIRNFGIFGGAGFIPMEGAALVYNLGVKFNFSSSKLQIQRTDKVLVPGIELMYGINTMVKAYDKPELNALFPGLTIGFNTEYRYSKSYFSLGILYPIMSSEAQTYIDKYGIIITKPGIGLKISVGIGLIF